MKTKNVLIMMTVALLGPLATFAQFGVGDGYQDGAHQWYTYPNGLYVTSSKIGIGTDNPARKLEVYQSGDNLLRITSIGGSQIEDHDAGLELLRINDGGSSTKWSLVNEGTLRLKVGTTKLFEFTSTIFRAGHSLDNPIEFNIYGGNIQTTGSSLNKGSLTIQSKLGGSHHVVRFDGNQMESNQDYYFHHLSGHDISMVNGGGKVRIGTSTNEARLNVGSEDMQLKLINPGNNGASWGIGVANSSWLAGAGKLIFTNTNSSADASMVITPAGNVGIGVVTPSSTLHVNGKTKTKVLQITGGADLAEPFEVRDEAELTPGSVVSIDPEHAGSLMIAHQAYDTKVAGIISGAGEVQAGMIMGQEGTMAHGTHPVALAGRVYVKVDASFGEIHPGDLLTTSNIPGHAMKVSDHESAKGAIIGKAMTGLEEGTGLVLVLVSLQ